MTISSFDQSKVYKFYPVSELISTSGQPSELQIQQIAACGFEVIINLGLQNDPRYSLPDEKGFVEALGLIYIHIPVQFHSPTENDLEEFILKMDTYLGKKIWIHCAANIRVSAFLGLYRIIRDGWIPYKAFEQMRKMWTPDQIWKNFITTALAKHNPNGVKSKFPATERTIQII